MKSYILIEGSCSSICSMFKMCFKFFFIQVYPLTGCLILSMNLIKKISNKCLFYLYKRDMLLVFEIFIFFDNKCSGAQALQDGSRVNFLSYYRPIVHCSSPGLCSIELNKGWKYHHSKFHLCQLWCPEEIYKHFSSSHGSNGMPWLDMI